MTQNTVWIIGAGPLSNVYVNVLTNLGYTPLVIGRGSASAERIAQETGAQTVTGGLEPFLKTKPELPRAACVVTGIETLADCAIQLSEYGVKDILCEKPGALTYSEIQRLAEVSQRNGSQCYIAYNRRFYASTQKARQILAEDGGVLNFHFEFTEWSDRIGKIKKAPGVHERMVLGNSTHVIDLAFYLGGWPVEIATFTAGENRIDWHPSSAVFAGSGLSDQGALFSYCANWDAPGRWGVEVMSRNYRMILRPMEELRMVRRDSVLEEIIEIDDALDLQYKHGLHYQISAFLGLKEGPLCSVQEQHKHWPLFERVAGYV